MFIALVLGAFSAFPVSVVSLLLCPIVGEFWAKSIGVALVAFFTFTVYIDEKGLCDEEFVYRYIRPAYTFIAFALILIFLIGLGTVFWSVVALLFFSAGVMAFCFFLWGDDADTCKSYRDNVSRRKNGCLGD